LENETQILKCLAQRKPTEALDDSYESFEELGTHWLERSQELAEHHRDIRQLNLDKDARVASERVV